MDVIAAGMSQQRALLGGGHQGLDRVCHLLEELLHSVGQRVDLCLEVVDQRLDLGNEAVGDGLELILDVGDEGLGLLLQLGDLRLDLLNQRLDLFGADFHEIAMIVRRWEKVHI